MSEFLSPSQVIDRRFKILKELGSGGSGSVFQVEDLRDGGMLALKVLNAAGRKPREKLLRFRREFRATSGLMHPNVVRVFEFVTGRPSYFTMEYVPGVRVSDYLDVSDRRPEALNHPRRLAKLFSILHQITSALAFVHDHRIVHRDLKPENILVADAPAAGGVAPLVKLMDFGLARDLRDSVTLTLPGVVLGTLAYVSPEQATSQPIDGRADLYALGVILYRLLTGTLPFTTNTVSDMLWKHYMTAADPPRTRNPDVHRLLERMCLRLLEKEPAARYQTAAEVGLMVDRAAGFDYPVPDVIRLDKREPETQRPLFMPRLVGRVSELGVLGQVVDDVAKGERRAVIVTGDVGMGRSRLLRELAGRTTTRARLLYSHCLRDDPRNLGGLRLALLGIADWLRTLSVSEVLRIVGSNASALRREFPELRSVAALDVEAPMTGSNQPLVELISDLLRATAKAWTPILVIDDLHHADIHTLDAIARMRARDPTTGRAMAVIASSSTQAAGDLASRLSAEVVPLSPLGVSGVVAMMHSMLGQENLPLSAVESVDALADGRAGYVEELVRLFVEQRALVREGTKWSYDERHGTTVARVAAECGVDRALADAIRRRVASIGAPARRLLGSTVLFGGEVSFDLLVYAAGDEDEAIDAVDALLRAGLLVEGRSDGSLAVSSELVETAVQADLQGSTRAACAQRLLTGLVAQGRRDDIDQAVIGRLQRMVEEGNRK